MFYLGIDLHRKQMTVSLRNEDGDVVLRRQVSTRWKKIDEFLEQVHQEGAGDEESYVAIVEVCGFHDWLVKRLKADGRCHDVIVVQPMKRSTRKTDRRDAHSLSELLWINRDRLLRGDRVQGVRRVHVPSEDEEQDRLLTQMRDSLTRKRTQTLNQIHKILRRHNLEWDRPTKTFQTQKVRQWLKKLELGEVERLAMDQLLAQWDLWDEQIREVDAKIGVRFDQNADAQLLATMHGVSLFMALAIACRIGPISRFPRGRSLANFFGLTPRSYSTGETERMGSITKEGSRLVRFLLGQVVVHLLRRDGEMRAWYTKIKRRRGSRIARVAVMRRVVVIMWHMLSKRQEWRPGTAAKPKRRPSAPRTAHQPIDRDAVQAEYPAPMIPAQASGESTGSSSLSDEQEVERCRA
jgi:transposase